jgi:hypothetical protein
MAITKWSIQAPSPKKSVAYIILCIIARASMILVGAGLAGLARCPVLVIASSGACCVRSAR